MIKTQIRNREVARMKKYMIMWCADLDTDEEAKEYAERKLHLSDYFYDNAENANTNAGRKVGYVIFKRGYGIIFPPKPFKKYILVVKEFMQDFLATGRKKRRSDAPTVMNGGASTKD